MVSQETYSRVVDLEHKMQELEEYVHLVMRGPKGAMDQDYDEQKVYYDWALEEMEEMQNDTDNIHDRKLRTVRKSRKNP